MFINGTVISDVYLSMLSDKFAPFMMGYDSPVNSAWFQQDGSRPRSSTFSECSSVTVWTALFHCSVVTLYWFKWEIL
jgi:hypothetical protein